MTLFLSPIASSFILPPSFVILLPKTFRPRSFIPHPAPFNLHAPPIMLHTPSFTPFPSFLLFYPSSLNLHAPSFLSPGSPPPAGKLASPRDGRTWCLVYTPVPCRSRPAIDRPEWPTSRRRSDHSAWGKTSHPFQVLNASLSRANGFPRLQ